MYRLLPLLLLTGCFGLTSHDDSLDPKADDEPAIDTDVEADVADSEAFWDTASEPEPEPAEPEPDPEPDPADTDPGPTTPPAAGNPDGNYVGSFELRYQVTFPFALNLGLCTGQIAVQVDQGAATQVASDVDCSWGFLAGYEDMVGAITGTVTSNTEASGTIDLLSTDGALGVYTDWEADFNGNEMHIVYEQATFPEVLKGNFKLYR